MPRPFSSLLYLAAVVAVVGVLPAPGVASIRSGQRQSSVAALERGVVARLNQIRARHGLEQLRLDPGLMESAVEHTDEMVADGYFGHGGANGSAYWRRIRLYYPAETRRVWAVGENILWATSDPGPESVVRHWMASPEHRANILRASWRDLGIDAVRVDDGRGVYGGAPVTVITTDFGVRR